MKPQTELELEKPKSNGLAKMGDISQFQALENFTKVINTPPPATSVTKTPDGNAETMPISFIETKLDEVYLRQWGTENVQITQIANEVLMTLTLWVIDPISKVKITRTGCAAVVITVDKVPDNIKGIPKEKNAWSLDMQNKKPNALYLAFPKLKAMATKNAAQTLGKSFGRDLNRKHEDQHEDFYENLMNDTATLGDAISEMQKATTKEAFAHIWNSHPELQQSTEFKKEFLFYQRSNVKA